MTLSEFRFVCTVAVSRFFWEWKGKHDKAPTGYPLEFGEEVWWREFQAWVSERWTNREGEGDV